MSEVARVLTDNHDTASLHAVRENGTSNGVGSEFPPSLGLEGNPDNSDVEDTLQPEVPKVDFSIPRRIPRDYSKTRHMRPGRQAEKESPLKSGIVDGLQVVMNEAANHPLLKPEEELELAKLIEAGDLDAKERLFNSNLRLVVANARRYIGQGLSFGDLIEEGMVGLMRAVEKFDWRKGFRFSTYATLWIRQAMQRALENTGRTIRMPVHVAQKARKFERIERELTAKLGREPTEEEVATAARVKVEEVKELREGAKVVVSLNKPVDEEGDKELGDFIPSSMPEPEEEAVNNLNNEVLLAAIGELPEQERKVIEMRFGAGDEEPATFSQAGRKLGVSTERARQIQERALRRLGQRTEIIALRENVG